MTVLTIDDRLGPVLEIAGSDGELHAYSIAPAPAGVDRRAVLLRRGDTGAEYRVAQVAPARWDCTCRNQTFRKRGAGPCKHIVAVSGLFVLVDQLTTR